MQLTVESVVVLKNKPPTCLLLNMQGFYPGLQNVWEMCNCNNTVERWQYQLQNPHIFLTPVCLLYWLLVIPPDKYVIDIRFVWNINNVCSDTKMTIKFNTQL